MIHSRFFRINPVQIILKFLFVIFYGVLGVLLANSLMDLKYTTFNPAGFGFGILFGVILTLLDFLCEKIPSRNLLSALFGLFVSLLCTKVVVSFLQLIFLDPEFIRIVAVFLFVSMSYVCTWIFVYSQEEYQFLIPFVRLKPNDQTDRDIILDTSVIIDGRIAEICQTTFLSGRIIIPRFVLKELQAIADSSDSLKRNRGRRGLDVLNKIKENSKLSVKIHEADFPEIDAVDSKLVKLAKVMNGRVFTNDFNLAKVAEVQNVEILNINEIANILKPVVLPGEKMQVKIIKEGKENTQGVAYLEDGTMVVVENGKRLIGKTVNVVITSAYQTQAGRMIFAKSEGE